MDLNQLNQYVNSTCTVYTDGGEALFPGLIAQCSGTLRINIVYDADTCCPYWTLKPASGIYLRLQDSQDSKKFIMIHGMVINAMNDHFFMLPQSIVFKSNEREYFRQPIQIETTVTIHNGQPVQHACILMDISGGGALLVDGAHRLPGAEGLHGAAGFDGFGLIALGHSQPLAVDLEEDILSGGKGNDRHNVSPFLHNDLGVEPDLIDGKGHGKGHLHPADRRILAVGGDHRGLKAGEHPLVGLFLEDDGHLGGHSVVAVPGGAGAAQKGPQPLP